MFYAVAGSFVVFLVQCVALLLYLGFAWLVFRGVSQTVPERRWIAVVAAIALVVLPFLSFIPGTLIAKAYCERFLTESAGERPSAASIAYPELDDSKVFYVFTNAAPTLAEIYELLVIRKFAFVEVPPVTMRGAPSSHGWPQDYRGAHRTRVYFLAERGDARCRHFEKDLKQGHVRLHLQAGGKISYPSMGEHASTTGLLPDLCIAVTSVSSALAELRTYEIATPAGITLVYRKELGFTRGGQVVYWRKGFLYNERGTFLSFFVPHIPAPDGVRRDSCGTLSFDYYNASDDIFDTMKKAHAVPTIDALKQVGTDGSQQVRRFYGL